MATIENILEKARDDARDLGRHLGAVGILDLISETITGVIEKANQSADAMDVLQNLALIAALADVGREKTVDAGVTKSSTDDLVHCKYTPTSCSFRLSPAELKEVFEDVPKAIKISKTLLKSAAPDKYVKFSDDAHKVEIRQPYASLTDSRGLIKMFEIFLQLAQRDVELQALYGQE